jgi:DNA-binding MurR/RpiR family transcriptional regulator
MLQLRPGVRDLGAAVRAGRFRRAGRSSASRDVLVVFDYRRYQADIVEFARQAA